MVVREPITVSLSARAGARARGHVEGPSNLVLQAGRQGSSSVFAETTRKFLMFGTNGRLLHGPRPQADGRARGGEPVAAVQSIGAGSGTSSRCLPSKGGPNLIASLEGQRLHRSRGRGPGRRARAAGDHVKGRRGARDLRRRMRYLRCVG